jgi:hypothetical protein
MLAKNANLRLFIKTWLRFYLRLCRDAIGLLKRKVRRNLDSNRLDHFKLRFSVGMELVKSLPSLLRKRWRIQRQRKLSPSEVEKWMVER